MTMHFNKDGRRGRLGDALRAVGDLLMPRTCLVCGRPLGVLERHLCLACAADLPYTYQWRQAHNPLADRFNAVLERHRGTEPMDYAYAVSLLYYKGPYRQIPRALKYHGNLSAGRHFGSMLGRHIASAPHLADIDLVIPVPLHWTRRRSRGYNQSAILARALTTALNASRSLAPSAPSPSPSVIPGATGNLPPAACRTDLLVRARRTRTQTRLTVDQKAQNVASAFRVPISPRPRFLLKRRAGHDENRYSRLDRESAALKVLASARHILIVDDTFTTGATLYACYAALRPYTSARISIATLAAVEGTPSAGP